MPDRDPLTRTGPGRYRTRDGRWYAEKQADGTYRLWRQTNIDAATIPGTFPTVADVRRKIAEIEAGP